MPLKDLEKHLTTCQWRMIRCHHCDQQHPACELSVRIATPFLALLQPRKHT